MILVASFLEKIKFRVIPIYWKIVTAENGKKRYSYSKSIIPVCATNPGSGTTSSSMAVVGEGGAKVLFLDKLNNSDNVIKTKQTTKRKSSFP